MASTGNISSLIYIELWKKEKSVFTHCSASTVCSFEKHSLLRSVTPCTVIEIRQPASRNIHI